MAVSVYRHIGAGYFYTIKPNFGRSIIGSIGADFFATNGSFSRICQALQDWHSFTLLQIQHLQLLKICSCSYHFAKFRWISVFLQQELLTICKHLQFRYFPESREIPVDFRSSVYFHVFSRFPEVSNWLTLIEIDSNCHAGNTLVQENYVPVYLYSKYGSNTRAMVGKNAGIPTSR